VAQERVEQREGDAGRERGIALPCPPARPRPGRDRRWPKGLPFRGFCWGPLCAKGVPERRRSAFQTVWSAVGEQFEFGANHSGMVNLWRRFVTYCGEQSAPLVVGGRYPISGNID
jgi:hypothetical protein